MIPPKEAVSNAKRYLKDILESEEEISDIRLEEVEFVKSDKQWLITLSYLRPRNTKIKNDEYRPFNAFRGLLNEEKQENNENRIYKRLVVDAESGDVEKMIIREVH